MSCHCTLPGGQEMFELFFLFWGVSGADIVSGGKSSRLAVGEFTVLSETPN